jgi:hypothetical protein
MSCEKYGHKYWCVKVKKTISGDGEIYLNADEVQFRPDGSVVFLGYGWNIHTGEKTRADLIVNLALSSGSWIAVYAASCLDGGAVAVQHWKGEVIR